MSGLGGLNKTPDGVVIGLVQLQLPTGVNFDGVPLVTGNDGPDEITPNQPFTPGSLRSA